MKLLARPVNYDKCPPTVAAYLNAGQAHLTVGKEYVVHAIAVFDTLTLVQIVDDLNYPSWKPVWAFSVSDNSLADDWICNAFPEGDPQLIVGPEFVAKDRASYTRMVELDARYVDKFWRRLEPPSSEGD